VQIACSTHVPFGKRGRGVKLPKAPRASGTVRKERLQVKELTLEWTAESETKPRVIDVSDWPGSPLLRQQMLTAFHEKTKDDWRSPETVDSHIARARPLLGGLEAAGVADFSQVSRHVLDGALGGLARDRNWSATHAAGVERSVRAWVADVPELPDTTRTYLRWSKQLHAKVDSGAREYLTKEQFVELREAAQQVVAKAVERVEAAYEDSLGGAELGSWRDHEDGSDERFRAALYGILTGGEDMSTNRWAPYATMRTTGGSTLVNWFAPTPSEALAMVTLVICNEGWNLGVVDRLRVASSAAGAGEDDDYLTMGITKARRGPNRAHSTALFESGDDASSASWVSMIQRATHPVREWLRHRGVDEDHLILFGSHPGREGSQAQIRRVHGEVSWGAPTTHYSRQRAAWVPDKIGILNFQVLHRTYQTVINPVRVHNTQATHFQDYLGRNPEQKARAMRIAAQGAQMGFDASGERFTLTLTPLVAATPEVLDGTNDTATAACKDITHNPITGQPCTESFMACLACPNAVVTLQHVPRLAYLWQALEDRRSAFTAGVWEPYRPHYLRLYAFLRNKVRLDDDGIKAKARLASKTDKAHVRRLLKGEYDA